MKRIRKQVNNDYTASISQTVCTLYNPFGEFVGFIDRDTARSVQEMGRRTSNYTYHVYVKVRG